MSSKHISVGIIVSSILAFLSPFIITSIFIKVEIKELYFISRSLQFIAIVFICVRIVQMRRFISNQMYRVSDRNRMNFLKYFLLILLGFFLSRVMTSLIGYQYIGKHTINFIYVFLIPLFLPTFLLGILVQKKGWALGFFVSSAYINNYIIAQHYLTLITQRIPFFEYFPIMVRSARGFSVLYLLLLVTGILGGFLGGRIGMLINWIKKK